MTFGTAGLRAPLGDGPGRMNRQVVAHAVAGLASWLRANEDAPTVVVGFDARRGSDVFARECVEVLAGAGLRSLLLPGPLATPVLAFAVGHLHASAGVMITASHNPATDNGLKLYLADTCQVGPPDDAAIAAHIAKTPAFAEIRRSSAWERAGDGIVAAYLDAVAGPARPSEPLTVAYTPLHGVGAAVFLAAAARRGHRGIQVVPEQAEPDPDFPTVTYPNPEEPGTLDRVFALGRRIRADLLIAHDPDADRCAVAVRDGADFRPLTGDELGILLADQLLRNGQTGTFASSIVSSDMLGVVAAAHGQRWQQTLTGFKWLGRVPDLAFAYEEAFGYCVAPEVARDKDGISAALAVLDLAMHLRRSGQTLLHRLDELFTTHGVHLTQQVSVRLASTEAVTAAMARLRADPPGRVGGHAVRSIDDLNGGWRDLPPADLLRFGLDGARVIIRPSGTEPKLKAYVEVRESVTGTLEPARTRAGMHLAAMARDLRTLLTGVTT